MAGNIAELEERMNQARKELDEVRIRALEAASELARANVELVEADRRFNEAARAWWCRNRPSDFAEKEEEAADGAEAAA